MCEFLLFVNTCYVILSFYKMYQDEKTIKEEREHTAFYRNKTLKFLNAANSIPSKRFAG